MKCVTWNLEWKSPGNVAGRRIREQIMALDPDVICFTEIVRTLTPEGHYIEADPDYGYPHGGERRKVILWSKHPWIEVDAIGDDQMPPGRFVSGVTGGIRFVGVCIPWRDAHVNSGRRDRSPWQDHLSYCSGLERILERYTADGIPICVLGDYNQRIPRVGQPIKVAKALAEAIPSDFKIVTEGMKDSEGKDVIDHVAVSHGLSVLMTQIISRYASDGTRLSDHVGVFASLENKISEQVGRSAK